MQTPHRTAARRDGAIRAVCAFWSLSAALAKGAGHSHQSAAFGNGRIPSRNASVATANTCAEAP